MLMGRKRELDKAKQATHEKWGIDHHTRRAGIANPLQGECLGVYEVAHQRRKRRRCFFGICPAYFADATFTVLPVAFESNADRITSRLL